MSVRHTILSANPNDFSMTYWFNQYHVELEPPACSHAGITGWLEEQAALLVRDLASGISVYHPSDHQAIDRSNHPEVYGIKKPGYGDHATWRYINELEATLASLPRADEVADLVEPTMHRSGRN